MDGLIEPYLIKAINLLHSSAKDAGDQLKAMLDEAIRLKNDTSSIASKLPTPLTSLLKKDMKKKSDALFDEDVPLSKRRKESPRSSQPSSPATSITKESKKKFEIFGEDDSSIKKFKDSPRSSLAGSPTGSSPQNSRSTSPGRKSPDSLSADDLAQDLMDLHCVVCNGLDVTSKNQLVECQECHGLYHQECHQPNISDAEVNDPRSVFFCSECSKTMKKTTTKPKPGSRDSPVGFAKSRSDSPSTVAVKSSPTLGFGKQGGPLAKTGGSKSSGSSSSSSSSSGSNVASSMMNADKRLQNLKKRAANKLQEKRKPGK